MHSKYHDQMMKALEQTPKNAELMHSLESEDRPQNPAKIKKLTDQNELLRKQLAYANAETDAVRAANRDLQQWFDDARAEAEKAQERITELEKVATDVRRDLMLRAEPDWDGSGQQVVNLSASIWDELNRVLDIKGNRREGE